MPRHSAIAKIVRAINELTSDNYVMYLGRLRHEYVSEMIRLGRHNLVVVLTGERRRHYLTDHPEMIRCERELHRVVLQPDQVHRNRKDPHTAIFYKRFDDDYFLRAAIVLQPKAGELKHSGFSFRLAKEKEVEDGRRAGRVIWNRK
ncbi:MAG: hypothetical protein HZC40_17625 [Chloroflexi bacterium]|nr:hypothetical protein [Chloroflexota bacterium]